MDNHDKKSELSPTEKRLKKSIARGAVGIRTKKHPLKTPVKIRPTFFKQESEISAEHETPFKPELSIENEDFVDIDVYAASAKSTPDSNVSELEGFQSLSLQDNEHDENISRLVSGAMISDSDNESGGEVVRKSDHSSEGLSSESSAQRGAVSHDEVYVRAQVDYRTGHILLSVSRLRPDTYLGRQQGAHITAYAVFVTSILESVDEQSIHEIPGLLAAIAKKFIPEERWQPLDARIQTMLREVPAHFTNKIRKKMTKDLRDKHVAEENVKVIKTALKVQQATFLAQLIGIISQEVLEGINQNRHRLYQRPKKKTKQDLGREGARIRQTLRSLGALQHLIQWKQSDKAATMIPEVLKKGNLRPGIKVFLGAGKHGSKEINAFLQAVKTGSISQERLQDISKVISRLVFDLFDLDYHEYKASLILQNIFNKATRSRFEQLLNTMSTEETIEAFLVEQGENLVQEFDLVDIEQEIIRNSTKIILQHFDIVMGHAFSSLNSLPLEIRRTICAEFLNHMQRNMHWPEAAVQRMTSSVIDSWLIEEEDMTDALCFGVVKS